MTTGISLNNSLYKVLTEPTKVFNYLTEHPSILRPFLLLLITGLFLSAVLFPFLLEGILDFFEWEYSVGLAITIFMVMALMLCGLLLTEWMILSVFIYFLSMALALKLVHFKTVSSFTGYSWVPIIIKTFGYAMIVLITGEIFQPQGLSAIFSETPSNLFLVILQHIDVFTIWQYGILLIGIHSFVQHRLKSIIIVTITLLTTITIKTIPYLLTVALLD